MMANFRKFRDGKTKTETIRCIEKLDLTSFIPLTQSLSHLEESEREKDKRDLTLSQFNNIDLNHY